MIKIKIIQLIPLPNIQRMPYIKQKQTTEKSMFINVQIKSQYYLANTFFNETI